MNAGAGQRVIGIALLCAWVACSPAGAVEPARVAPSSMGFTEAVVASCAGGAAIGYLVATASGGVSAAGTAATFCGLSVAASLAGTVAVRTLRGAIDVAYGAWP